MKNFLRICSAVLAVGGVLCIVGAAAGGRLYSVVQNGVLRPAFTSVPLRVEKEDGTVDGRAGMGRSSSSAWAPAGQNAALDDIPDTPDDISDRLPAITGMKKLDFELGMGEFTIVEGDAFTLEYEGSWIDSTVEDGVWEIRTEGIFSNILGGADRSCIITVPAGCAVEKLDLEVGAATVEVNAPISAREADLEIGAGGVEFSLLTVSDKIEIDVGMGSLGLGLAGSWSDYAIEAEVAMGSITINGEDLVSGLVGTRTRGNGRRQIEAEVGMGSLDITTQTA